MEDKTKIQYYMAPLEGITTYIYRNAYHRYFTPMDKYFTPFLVPHTKKGFSAKERGEILPEHNEGMYLVPQIMSNDAEGFLHTVEKLKRYGYKEVNLNLGCPSKTVVSKGRGAGFLAKPDELHTFLEEIFQKADVAISIKTRIGKDSPDEFERLLEIYNEYPLKELIIHPRIQLDFYKNVPNLDVYAQAYENCRHPLCYNGDICSAEDEAKLLERFGHTGRIMLGRGLIANPGLAEELRGGSPADKERLRAFHDQIMDDYTALDFGDRNVLFKMKELWVYMQDQFPDSAKLVKKIKKATNRKDYEKAVDEMFQNR